MKKAFLVLFLILSGCAQKAALRPVTVIKPSVVCPLDRNLSQCRVNHQSANIVLIYNRNEANELVSAATGFVVDEDGLIMTAKHVVEEPSVKTFVMVIDGKTLVIRRVQRNFVSPSHDVAIFKIDYKFRRRIQFRTGELIAGESLYAIGFPLTQSKSILGIILHNRLPYVYGSGEYTLEREDWQLSTIYVAPGYSGAPIFDYEGRAVGIVIASVRFTHIGNIFTLSVASRHCAALLATVKKFFEKK